MRKLGLPTAVVTGAIGLAFVLALVGGPAPPPPPARSPSGLRHRRAVDDAV
jgi:hypothetical protein